MAMIRKAFKWLLIMTGVSLSVIVIIWISVTFLPPLIEWARAMGPFAEAAIWIAVGFIVGVLVILLLGLASRIKELLGRMKKESTEGLIIQAGSHVENEIFKTESGTLKNLVNIPGEKLPRAPLVYVPAPEGLAEDEDPIWDTKLLTPTYVLLYNGLFRAYVVPRPSGKSPAVVAGGGGVRPSQHVTLEASRLDGGDRDEHDR